MKKILSIILCLCLMLGVFAVPAAAYRTNGQKNCEDAIISAIYNMKSGLDVSKYQVYCSNIEDIFVKIYYHYPEISFYVDYDNTEYEYNQYTNIVSYVYFEYTMSKSDVLKKRDIINETAAAFLYGIDDNWSDAIKALYIHDMMCVNYQYDNTYFVDEDEAVYQMLEMIEEGVGVCQAYAEMYSYLLRLCGIDSYIVASDEDNHAWNVVKINNRWYHVDVTFDDPVVDEYAPLDYLGRASHKYFLVSDMEINDGSHDYFYIPYEVDEYIYCYEYVGNDSFREAVSAVLLMDDGYWYYMDYDLYNGGLVRTKDFYNTQLVYRMDGYWEIDEDYGYYDYYTGLYEYNGNLFFIDSDSLYVYDPETNIVEGVMGLDEDGKSYGRFYGYYMYGETCIFMVARDANGLDMTYLEIGVCDKGHSLEKWLTLEEATMFKDGKRVVYCDVCFDITYEETLPKLPIPEGAGDADGDGTVSTSDLATEKLLLADCYGGKAASGADFNKDSYIDTTDLSLLKLFLATA